MYMTKYVIGAVSAILLLVLAFVLVVNKGNDNQATTKEAPKILKLTDYADRSSQVVLHTDGRLVGEEDRRSVRITVSANERRLEVLSGYNGQVVNSQSYPNTQAAYSVFLNGLSGAGFMKAKKTSITNPQSICTGGKHYYYNVSENGEKKSDLWSTSCDKSGTFDGRASTVRELFQLQIPDYNKQVQDIKL